MTNAGIFAVPRARRARRGPGARRLRRRRTSRRSRRRRPSRATSGSVTSSGNGPGGPPSPAPSPGTGTCTNDCDGTGQGPGPGGPATAGAATATVPARAERRPLRQRLHGPGGTRSRRTSRRCSPTPSRRSTRPQMLYRSVLETFGAETVPFALIAEAEARHVEALQMLFTRRQMAPPASVWAPGELRALRLGAPRLRGGRRGRDGGRGLLHAVPAAHRPAAGRPQRLHEPAGGLAREPPPGLRALPVGDAMTRNAPLARASLTAEGRRRTARRSAPAPDGLSSRT